MGGRMYTAEVANRIDQVDPEAWDALCGGRSFVDHRWLRLAEAVLLDHEPYYLQLRRGGRLEGGAVCAIPRKYSPFPSPRPSASVANLPLQRLVGRLLAPFPPLLCGVPISFEPGLLTRPGCDAASVVPALLGAISDLAKQQHVSRVGLRHLSGHDPAWPALRAAGYHRVGSLPATCLELSWPTFTAYQASLPSRHRKELARVRRRSRETGVTVSVLDPALETEPLLRQLVRNVFERYAERDPCVPDLFSRARAVLGDDFTLLVARRERRPIGCLALLRSGDELLVKWPGRDYNQPRDAFTYHALMTESVPKSIDTGVRRLWLGPTAYRLKRDMGASLDERYAALAAGGRLLNRLLGLGLTLAAKRLAASPATSGA